jgi:hypothetical protein
MSNTKYMSNTKTRAARSIEMSDAGRSKWQAALAAKNIGTATQLLAHALSITSEPTARKALNGEKLDKKTWEAILQDLNLNLGDFFPDAQWFEQIPVNPWEQLLAMATDGSARFGMVIPDSVKCANVRNALKSKNPPKYLPKFPIKTQVILEIDAQCSGHLILLEQNSDGGIDLLSPSVLMPDNLLTGKIQYLPQRPLPRADISEVIELEPVGTRYLWAGIFAQLPDWEWLEGAREDLLDLQGEQLRDLLGYAQESPEKCRLWKTSYEVV